MIEKGPTGRRSESACCNLQSDDFQSPDICSFHMEVGLCELLFPKIAWGNVQRDPKDGDPYYSHSMTIATCSFGRSGATPACVLALNRELGELLVKLRDWITWRVCGPEPSAFPQLCRVATVDCRPKYYAMQQAGGCSFN